MIEIINEEEIKKTKKCLKNNCDRCGASFENTPGTPLREIKKGIKTENWLCRQCYMKDWHNEHKGIQKNSIYNETNTCDRCGKNLLLDNNPRRECDMEGNWTGKWDCRNCYEKFDPNSQLNIKKSLRNCRTDNVIAGSNQEKGDLSEELTCRWRGVDNLNKKLDCYNTPIDHSKDPELGTLQTKVSLYDCVQKRYTVNTKNEKTKEFDNLIVYCISRNKKIIEGIYIFPRKEVITRTGISIFKTNLRKSHWYEKYRITDVEIIKTVNKIWEKILEENNI